VLAIASCRGKATREDCDRMIEHYLDMVMREDPSLASLPPESMKAAREVKRELRRGDPHYRKVAERCEAEVTRSEVSCGVDAKTTSDWEACIALAPAPSSAAAPSERRPHPQVASATAPGR
jgi:hypothetical protein